MHVPACTCPHVHAHARACSQARLAKRPLDSRDETVGPLGDLVANLAPVGGKLEYGIKDLKRGLVRGPRVEGPKAVGGRQLMGGRAVGKR